MMLLLLRLLCVFFIQLFGAVATIAREDFEEKPFSCTGGTIYFTAHPVDSLLFQNPDLFHDLYVYKCVTTVVFTSGDRGVTGNHYFSLERGLNEAYAWMAGSPKIKWSGKNTTVLIDKYEVQSWSLDDLPNMQNLYLRLPDGAPHGHGYDANGGQSLMKLYKKEIKHITTVDGSATYTLNELEELVATVLHERRPNEILILDHKATAHTEHGAGTDHADHIFSAKLVKDVIEKENIEAKVQAYVESKMLIDISLTMIRYAGEFMRRFQPNLNVAQADFDNKAKAFFKYAICDKEMCQTLVECAKNLKDEVKHSNDDFQHGPQRFEDDAEHLNDEFKYLAQYLEREYYVS